MSEQGPRDTHMVYEEGVGVPSGLLSGLKKILDAGGTDAAAVALLIGRNIDQYNTDITSAWKEGWIDDDGKLTSAGRKEEERRRKGFLSRLKERETQTKESLSKGSKKKPSNESGNYSDLRVMEGRRQKKEAWLEDYKKRKGNTHEDDD